MAVIPWKTLESDAKIMEVRMKPEYYQNLQKLFDLEQCRIVGSPA